MQPVFGRLFLVTIHSTILQLRQVLQHVHIRRISKMFYYNLQRVFFLGGGGKGADTLSVTQTTVSKH